MNNAEVKTMEIGGFRLSLDEEKVHELFRAHEYARYNDMQRNLSNLIDLLIKADEQDVIDEDVVPWLYMLVDMKRHYEVLASLGIIDTEEQKRMAAVTGCGTGNAEGGGDDGKG